MAPSHPKAPARKTGQKPARKAAATTASHKMIPAKPTARGTAVSSRTSVLLAELKTDVDALSNRVERLRQRVA